jgi:hypothetical protein
MMTEAAPGSQLHGLGQELQRLNQEKAEAEKEKARLTAEIKQITESATPTNLAALNEEIKRVGEALGAANPYVQQAGLESLSEVIESVLAAELKVDGSGEPSDTTARAAAALQMLRAMAVAKDSFAPDPNQRGAAELLLAAAYLRHQLRVVQVDVARDAALRKNYEAQGLALLTKVSHLVRVYANLQAPGLAGTGDFATARASENAVLRTAAGETLASYLGAWNHGEIPRRVLAFRNVQIQRASALEKAALTEEDYRTILKPVFDELAAYGEGGIRPETIVEVLSNLGVATAVLGD